MRNVMRKWRAHHKDECSTLPLDNNNTDNNSTKAGFGSWKWHGVVAVGDKACSFQNKADEVHVPDQRVYTVDDPSILQSGRHRIPQDGRYK